MRSFPCDANLPGPSIAEMCGASQFFVFLTLLDELIRSNEKISGSRERVRPIETPDEEYDFVVIGGGGAGAVAAARLSENPHWKVLLLEAGHDEPNGAQIPLYFSSLLGTEVDWQFKSSNESCGCLSGNGSCSLAAGKMLGGSTAHNGMIYLRGNPRDYNNWAKKGNTGWTWKEVEPFFIKSENNGQVETLGRKHHGTGGPLSVQNFPYQPPLGDSVLAASHEQGYTFSSDLNGDQVSGFSIAQANVKDGVRQSSSRAFLWPARDRKNLDVSLNSYVTKVMVEDDTAVGVEFYQNGQRKTVRVTQEVIISAGAVKSPQLLLLSGIGPKDHLEASGVKVVKNLPGVGENFHNHVGFILAFTVNGANTYDNDYDIAAQYMVNQTGPLSGPLAVGALLCSDKTDCDFPDLHFYFGGFSTPCAPGEVDALVNDQRRPMIIFVSNLHPKSRGRISLASSDPFEDPVIWGGFLSDSSDVEVLIKGIKMSLSLANTRALRARNITLSSTSLEACSDHEFMTDEYWACAIRQNTTPENHFAGSCKMGPSSDPLAVVDHRLRVYGIKGLRVGDASIIPQVISGNTAAASMMIGERVADFIKKDRSRRLHKRRPDSKIPSK